MQAQKIIKAKEWLSSKTNLCPELAIVLGSGLESRLPWQLVHSFDYAQIPNFPTSTAPGHTGRLLFYQSEQKTIMVFAGRFHLYEGYSPAEVVFGLRVAKFLGIKQVILTNAAGALNPLFEPGQIMLITDQINFTGENPLVGPNMPELGPRFPDMSQVYSLRLQKIACEQAMELKIPLTKGTYIQIKGPSLETPAETRAYRMLGADAIGMSTGLEAIACKHMGLEILGLSCLTNKNLPDCMQPTTEEEILNKARQTSADLTKLLVKIIPKM